MSAQDFIDSIAADLARQNYYQKQAWKHERAAFAAAKMVLAGTYLVSGDSSVLVIDVETSRPELVELRRVSSDTQEGG